MAIRFFIATLLVLGSGFGASRAHAADDAKSVPDVFLDEGSADDFTEPKPMEDPSAPTAAAPAAKPTKKSTKAKAAKPTPAPAPEAEAPARADEAQAPATDAAPAPISKAAKATSGKGRFRTTNAECPMHADASEESATVAKVGASKKIWTESASEGWIKVFRKKGVEAYVAASCFN